MQRSSEATAADATPGAVVLVGRTVRLEPMAAADAADLLAAADEDRSTYGFTLVPTTAEAMARWVEGALADARAGRAVPLVTRTASGRVVGSTRFMDLERWEGPLGEAAPGPTVLEIGATWLAASAQRTAVNTEAKLLMLTHAFDEWRVERVTFKTDRRNQRSRRAIERLGARFEGVRRAHLVATDGTIRDSAYYSIVRAEWPEVRRTLEERLDGAR